MTTAPRRSPLVSATFSLLWTGFEAALLAAGIGGLERLVRDPRALVLLALFAASGLLLSIRRPTRSRDLAEKRPDPLPMVVLFVAPLLMPAVAAFGASRALFTLPYANTVSWCGVALVALGLFVRVSAMFQLGPRFSPLVSVQREHALETHGLYAFVRHPGYIGNILPLPGIALALSSTWTFIPAAVALVIIVIRTVLEDRTLREELPGYQDYARRVRYRLFPGIY